MCIFALMKTNVNLKPYNSFGFNAVAKYLVEINDIRDLQALIKSGELQKHKTLILSGGNNILFTNDFFNGIVILMNTKGIEVMNEEGNDIILRVQAGEDWPDFVRYCVDQGWFGIENLAHIPGKVGAAPVQNIGAYHMELQKCFVQCEAIEITSGKTTSFSKAECQFGYRESIFKHECKGKYVITSVDIKLHKQAELDLSYDNIKDYLVQHGTEQPTLRQLHDAICAIRDGKLPDVKQIGCAGSFFKNPLVDSAKAETLIRDYPSILDKKAIWNEPNGMKKVSAGWLIEQAGWKGHREGPVGVYEEQALILVHYGGGKGSDIVKLAHKIQDSVEKKFGIRISPEVNFV